LPLAILGPFNLILSKCNCGRQLLEKHPRFFTLGYISRNGPTREQIRENSFETVLVGYGWDKRDTGSDLDNPPGPPTKTIVCKVSGPDFAYVATASFVVQSAMTILHESEKMPKK